MKDPHRLGNRWSLRFKSPKPRSFSLKFKSPKPRSFEGTFTSPKPRSFSYNMTAEEADELMEELMKEWEEYDKKSKSA